MMKVKRIKLSTKYIEDRSSTPDTDRIVSTKLLEDFYRTLAFEYSDYVVKERAEGFLNYDLDIVVFRTEDFERYIAEKENHAYTEGMRDGIEGVRSEEIRN